MRKGLGWGQSRGAEEEQTKEQGSKQQGSKQDTNTLRTGPSSPPPAGKSHRLRTQKAKQKGQKRDVMLERKDNTTRGRTETT